jgi:hypothetical protein
MGKFTTIPAAKTMIILPFIQGKSEESYFILRQFHAVSFRILPITKHIAVNTVYHLAHNRLNHI